MYLWKENEDMFGTFRYNKTTRNLDHIQLSNDDNVDARGHTLVACDPCRAQKLKCNGDRNTCDRCLASSSKTCTYIERKRPNQLPIPSKRQKREKAPDSTESKDLDASSPDNSREISTSWSDDSAISCGLSPLTLPPTIEPQLFIGSDLSWDSIGELIDTSNISDIETFMSPSRESICEPIWRPSSELELIGEPYEVSQGQPPSYHEDPSSKVVGKVVHQVYCNCLHTMTQLLEETESTVESQGVDEFMMCLGRGMKLCESVLTCIHCNACVDNAMLFTSNAQQLVSTAQKVSSKLLLTHSAGRRRSDTNKLESYGVSESEDDLITFGRYRIEQPEMRIRLIYQMVLLHIEDLQQLLAKIKKGVGMKRKAQELLADAESNVAKLSRVIRELAK